MMTNKINDYLNWRGDLTFFQDPFNEVDALALSMATYVELDRIVSSDLKEQIPFCQAAELLTTHLEEKKYHKTGLIIPEEVITLFLTLAQCNRYKNLRLSGYINHIDEENEKQFAAVTFQNDNGELYIVYRGTDDTIVGWREDFNMAFLDVLPAQKEAALYYREVLRSLKGKVRIMGHSKGGNLSVYSAVRGGKLGQKRLLKVYCLDGPGFLEDFFSCDSYQNISEKIFWYLPYESIIGNVLTHGQNEVVVKSTAKGIMQHNPLSWCLNRNSFVREKELSKEATLAHLAISECMDKLTLEQRKQFVGIIFDALESTEAKKLGEIRLKNLVGLIDSVKKLDPESKELFKETGRLVLKTVKENR